MGFSNTLSLSCVSHRSREMKSPPWKPSTMGNRSLKPEWTLTYPGSAWNITRDWQDLWLVRTLLEFALYSLSCHLRSVAQDALSCSFL